MWALKSLLLVATSLQLLILLPSRAQHRNIKLHEVPLSGQVLSKDEGVLLQGIFQY